MPATLCFASMRAIDDAAEASALLVVQAEGEKPQTQESNCSESAKYVLSIGIPVAVLIGIQVVFLQAAFYNSKVPAIAQHLACNVSLYNSSTARPCCLRDPAQTLALAQTKVDLARDLCKDLHSSWIDKATCQVMLRYQEGRLYSLEAGPLHGSELIMAAMGILFVGVGMMLFVASIGYSNGAHTLKGALLETPLWPQSKEINLRGQAILTLLLPWVSLTTGSIVSFSLGPAAGQSMGLIGPFLAMSTLRMLWVKAAWAGDPSLRGVANVLMADIAGLVNLALPKTVLALLEVADAVSDGFTTSAMLFLDEEQKARFAASFSESPGFVRGPAVFLGLAGFGLLALCLATFVQLGMVAQAHRLDADDKITLANFAGLVPPEELYVEAVEESLDGTGPDGAAIRSNFGRVVAEGLVQMLLQSALLMAVGEGLTSQPLLLLSLVLSLVTSVRKGLEVNRAVAYGLKSEAAHGRACSVICLGAVLTVPPALAMLGLPLLCGTRIAFLQACPCHSWGVTTGCLNMQ